MDNLVEVNIGEFVQLFADGVEELLWNTDRITKYVDSELAEYLDVDIDCIPEDELKKVMVNISLELISRGYGACVSSSNEITAEK